MHIEICAKVRDWLCSFIYCIFVGYPLSGLATCGEIILCMQIENQLISGHMHFEGKTSPQQISKLLHEWELIINILAQTKQLSQKLSRSVWIVIQKIQSSLQTYNALLTCLSGKLLCNLLTQLVNSTYMSMFSHSQKNFSQNLINQWSNMIARLLFVLFALLVQCPA